MTSPFKQLGKEFIEFINELEEVTQRLYTTENRMDETKEALTCIEQKFDNKIAELRKQLDAHVLADAKEVSKPEVPSKQLRSKHSELVQEFDNWTLYCKCGCDACCQLADFIDKEFVNEED